MKKYLIVLAFVMLPLVVSAQTISSAPESPVSIQQLQAQIQTLQTQIADLQAEVQSVKLELKFSRVLAKGATGEDVKQLQEFLKTFTGAYPSGAVTGYYGSQTAAAVKKFQKQNGIAQVGIVGPKTQDKLSALAAAIPATPAVPAPGTEMAVTPVTPAIPATPATSLPAIEMPPLPTTPATPCINCKTTEPFSSTVIKVLSPNGGEQWLIGKTYTIKYSAKNIVGNEPLLIYLEKGYDAPSTKTGVNSSMLIGVTTNLESYTYTVPRNIASFPGVGSNYTIKIVAAGAYYPNGAVAYVSDASDDLFGIAAGPDFTPLITTPPVLVAPVIPPVNGGGYGAELIREKAVPTSAPTPVSAIVIPEGTTDSAPQPTPTPQEQIAAIYRQVSSLQDKLNTTTNDETRAALMAQIMALKSQMQALQNAIGQPQSSGQTTVSTAPVVTVVPSINVILPNGGETLTTGKMYTIKWTGGNNAVDVYLLDNPTRLGKRIFSGIKNDNYVSWAATPFLSSDLYNDITNTFVTPSGQYIIMVQCTDNSCTVDDSDSYFKIVTP